MLRFIVPICVIIAISCNKVVADVTIVSNGKSDFSIVLTKDAPQSVKAAAEEMQKDIYIATGVRISVSNDTTNVTPPYISLGETQQAQKSNITTEGVKAEGYRICTTGGNVYIIGSDTADGSYTENGGTSNGTANGVYTFLEDYLDVRWLGLGDLWRDVPTRKDFTIKEIDRSESPYFIYRDEIYMQNNNPAVARWEKRQKLGYSFRLNAGHNWIQTITPDMRDEHPDWFAMRGGKRIKPEEYDKFYKLESTNPEVVQYFADEAIKYLKQHPNANTFSISPSDGPNWSQSPESKKYYDPAPKNSQQDRPSVTPLVLKFYHDVAKIVEHELPAAKLGGNIYAGYLYPPQKGEMKLPVNFYPRIAPSISYGYKLYRPEVQKDFGMLLSRWSNVTPNLFYYDLPDRIRQNAGLVTPVAPEILNFIFPQLIKNKIKGVKIYGNYSWSESAMNNYVRAKMLWNPRLDATDIQYEWLLRSYGKNAGTKMELFYQKLNSWYRDYYRKHTLASYTLTPLMLKEIYADHYPELERLYLQAASESMTARQKERLQQIGNNITIMQWRLNNLDLLPSGFEPQLSANEEIVNDIFAASEDVPAGYYGMIPTTKDTHSFSRALMRLKFDNVKVLQDTPKGKKDSMLLNKNLFMIYATKDKVIQITPRFVDHKSWAATFILRDKDKVIKTGLLRQGKSIEFAAIKGQNYYLSLPPFRYADAYDHELPYAIQIDDAKIAESSFDKSNKTLYIKDKGASIYIYGAPNHIFNNEAGAVISTTTSSQVAKLWLTGVGSVKQIRAGLAKKGKLEILLQNGNFSIGPKNNLPNNNTPDDWESQGAPEHWNTWQEGLPRGTFTHDIETNHGQGQGGSIKMAGFGKIGTVIQSIPVTPEGTYAIHGWMRQRGEGMGKIKVRWKKANGNWANRPFDKTFYASFGENEEDWQDAGGIVAAPPDVNKMVILLEAEKQTSPNDIIWFDDMEVFKVD